MVHCWLNFHNASHDYFPFNPCFLSRGACVNRLCQRLTELGGTFPNSAGGYLSCRPYRQGALVSVVKYVSLWGTQPPPKRRFDPWHLWFLPESCLSVLYLLPLTLCHYEWWVWNKKTPHTLGWYRDPWETWGDGQSPEWIKRKITGVLRLISKLRVHRCSHGGLLKMQSLQCTSEIELVGLGQGQGIVLSHFGKSCSSPLFCTHPSPPTYLMFNYQVPSTEFYSYCPCLILMG